MNIFGHDNYPTILRQNTEERRRFDASFSFQNLARHMGIQKSYLSKVLGGRAELSSDQMFSACEYLGFDADQRAYMFLLLEYARCGLKKRKQLLRAQIRDFQERSRETKKHLATKIFEGGTEKSQRYFLEPIHQIVHVCLSIERYRDNPEKLAADLRIPPSRLATYIAALESMGVISLTSGKIKLLQESVHLPVESALYRPWRNESRLLSLQRLNSLEGKSGYSFSVLFSATEDVRNALQMEFLTFLKKSEALALNAKAEEVFQMSFDLFSWTQD